MCSANNPHCLLTSAAAVLAPQGFTTHVKWQPCFSSPGVLVSPSRMNRGGYRQIAPGQIMCKAPMINGEWSTASVGSNSSCGDTLQLQHQGQQQHRQEGNMVYNTNSTSIFTFSPDMPEASCISPCAEIKLEIPTPTITPGPHLHPVAMPFLHTASPMQSKGSPYFPYCRTPYHIPEHSAHVGVDNNNKNNNSGDAFVTCSPAADLGDIRMTGNPVFVPLSPSFSLSSSGN